MKVLIIDDQADIGTMVKKLLFNREYTDTKAVVSGKLALEALREDKYNLVICDFDMPEMNGHEVYQQMRSEGNECPFLLYTNAEMASLPKFEGAGFLGAINKKELAKLFGLVKSLANIAN